MLSDCPEDLRSGRCPTLLTELAQQAFIVRLYQLGQLSSGRAAEVLHISRRDFLDLLSSHGVSMFDEESDLLAEASMVQSWGHNWRAGNGRAGKVSDRRT